MGRTLLEIFAGLEDDDVIASIKQWQFHSDRVLACLSSSLINRKLFRIRLQNSPFETAEIEALKTAVKKHYQIDENDLHYLVMQDSITNSAYIANDNKINILQKNGQVWEIDKASDINLSGLSDKVRKYFVCYPKELDIR